MRFDRTNPAPFFLDIGTTENLVLNMNGGDDTFTAGNGLAGLINLTVDGGAGNDTTRMQIDDRVVNLSPGMAATVEIKTGSRTMLSYLLSPLLRYRQEAFHER